MAAGPTVPQGSRRPTWERRAWPAPRGAVVRGPPVRRPSPAPTARPVTGLAGDGGVATWSAAMAAAQLQASAPAAGRGRKRGRAASVEYDTHAERRHAKAMRKADEMVAALPDAVVLRAVAGDGAGASGQMPPVAVQRELLRDTFLAKGGPEGGTTQKALRAWTAHQKEVRRRGAPRLGLPCEPVLAAEIVRKELDAAMARGVGGQGGRTVGQAFVDGFAALRNAGLPFPDPKLALIVAAAIPRGPRVVMPKRHAGSFPIGVRCQLEHLAGSLEWEGVGVVWPLSRAFLLSSLVHDIRLNDALNAKLRPDERDPEGVVRGSTVLTASKDGMPLQLYAYAEGWLGPLWWLGEHLDMMADRGHAIPNYTAKPAAEGAQLKRGVATPDRARKALRALLALPPLCMSKAEFDALDITTHSPHGTGCDMTRSMTAFGVRVARAAGADGFGAYYVSPMGDPFTEADARRIGHWLRDKNAPQPDPRQAGAPSRRQPEDGARAARNGMNFRYSQGNNRRGERDEQLDVRARFTCAVRAALGRHEGGWWTLPKTLDSWDVLRLAADVDDEGDEE